MTTNPAPLFDPTSHTQGNVKHLLQHLWDSYVTYLGEEIEKMTAAGKEAISLVEGAKRAKATHFVEWAGRYLLENRHVETFYVDENVGLRLTNGAIVALSPGVAGIQGSMQDANAVAVTHGRSQRGQEGVVDINSALPIR